MVMTYGATVTQLHAPDRNGRSANVALGLPTLADYVAKNSPSSGGGPYFGSIVGRYANRIAEGAFTLEGKTYGRRQRHRRTPFTAGIDGLDHKVWTATEAATATVGLELALHEPGSGGGIPGTLDGRRDLHR